MLSFDSAVNANAQVDPDPGGERAARGNRRRLRVFALVFLLSLAIGLAYTYARPAEYRAQTTIAVKTAATVQAVPTAAAAGAATVTTTAGSGNAASLQAEAGVLTSRSLIEATLPRLQAQGVDLTEFEPGPVQGIQAMLAAAPVPDTHFIAVSAIGQQPEHLALILNNLVEVYSRQLIDGYSSSASAEIESLRQELANLDQRLAEKRKAVEDFRQSADIVSGERDENQILSRVKGLSTSLNQANDKLAQAEARVRSLRESAAAGKSAVSARDNPTLAALESRASQLRETLREQERIFTPQYMEMDQGIRGNRSRLADLERQLTEQRGAMGQAALAEAEDELAAARQVQARLQRQLADERGAVHAFSSTFSAYKSMQEELSQLESGRRGLSERLLRTETSEQARMPSVQIIEAAVAPHEVWRPMYARDAGISLAAAFVLALLAMAVVELFNRSPPPSGATLVISQPWMTVGRDPVAALADYGAPTQLPRFAAAPARLPGASMAARELDQDEVAGLLQAMDENDRTWAGLLLCGATTEEIRQIRSPDLDPASSGIRLHGPCARMVQVPPLLLARLHAAGAEADGEGAAGGVMPDSDDECRRRLLCAAHDADLDDPAAITPQTLRHTCIAYLVRQGLRFSELDRIVGTVSADMLAHYAGIAPAGLRRTQAQVDLLMPALRGAAHG